MGVGNNEKRRADGQLLEQQEKDPKRSRRGNLDEIPSSAHYQISFMHKATVSHVISSTRYGYVVTACEEGIVKFWKRTSTMVQEEDRVATKKTLLKTKNNRQLLAWNSSSRLLPISAH